MPPFVRQNRQLNDTQNKNCYKVASLRIHVERCIARLKTFGVLRFSNHHLYPYFDKILLILAYVTNMMPPLIADKEKQSGLQDKIDDVIRNMASLNQRSVDDDED